MRGLSKRQELLFAFCSLHSLWRRASTHRLGAVSVERQIQRHDQTTISAIRQFEAEIRAVELPQPGARVLKPQPFFDAARAVPVLRQATAVVDDADLEPAEFTLCADPDEAGRGARGDAVPDGVFDQRLQ